MALLIAAAVVSLLQVVVSVTQSDDFVVKHLVLDDAIYFCKPARNFVEGRGYSFDGLHLTNGVQPLWAILVTLLASVVRDDMILIRTIAALSGICWIAAAGQLYRWQAGTSPFAAAIAGIGWLLAGVEFHLAHTGMENGLQGLLVTSALLAARNVASTPPAARERLVRTTVFGLWCAAMCLNRVEYGLLAAFWATWLFCSGQGPLRQRLGGIAPFVLPVAIATGAWAVFSRVYFGDWTPVSGAVKAHVTSHLLSSTSLLESFWHHALIGVRIAMLPVLLGSSAASGWLDFFTIAQVFVLAGAVAAAIGGIVWFRRIRAGGAPPSDWPTIAFFLFVPVHVLLVARFLAAFSNYCNWWFTGEVLAVWAAVGLLLGKTRSLLLRLAMLPFCLCVVVAAAQRPSVYLARDQWRIPGTEDFVELGRWIESWLPAGSRIGAFNSGFVAFEARSHTVVNLDGLMNDGDFLRRYLVRGAVDEYLAAENIRYVTDNMPMHLWAACREGVVGSRLPKNMRPLLCRRSSTGFLACVFDAFPDAPGPRIAAHPLAATLWRALSGQEKLVEHADRGGIPADRQIVASLADRLTGAVQHVVLTRAEAAVAVDAEGLARMPAIGASFGGFVALMACDAPESIRRGSTVSFTTYWRRQADAMRDDVRFGLTIGEPDRPAAPSLTRSDEPAHGTLPPRSWPTGQLLAHTAWLTIPSDLTPGTHPVWVTVRTGTEPVAPFGRPGTAVRVGTLRITD